MARCPVTGRWLDTGVVVSDDTFQRLDRIESRVFCVSCAAIHSWNRQTAALEGDEREVDRRLTEEQALEMERDRAYWEPLRNDLERLRRERRRRETP